MSHAFAELAASRLVCRVRSLVGHEKLACDRLDDIRPQFDDETVLFSDSISAIDRCSDFLIALPACDLLLMAMDLLLQRKGIKR